MVGEPHRQRPRARRAARAPASSSVTSRTFAANALGALGPLGLVAQQVPVVLHRRAAAGGVHDDVLVALERLDRAPWRRLAGAAPRPACSWSAPQQRGGARRVHLEALGGEHRARWPRSRRAKNTRCTQPWSSATVPRRSPARLEALGQPRERAAPSASARARPARRAAAPASRAAARRAERGAAERAATAAAQRAQPARVGEAARRRSRRNARSRAGARQLRSTCARVSSISLSYCTPDGQAVTHAMQPRQLSMCSTSGADSSEPSSSPRFISTIRPRGESISSPHSE